MSGETDGPRSRSSRTRARRDIGDGPEGLGRLRPDRAVIARIGGVEGRLALGVGRPIEPTAIDDGAADGDAVAAEILGGGIDYDRRAMVEWARQERRGGVVDDERDAEAPADLGHLRDGEDREFRVGQRLAVIGAGAVVGGAAEILRVGRIDEADLDSLLGQRVGEEAPGAAIEVGGGDDVVAHPREVLHRQGGGRLARRQGQRRRPAFEGGEALLQHVDGGVRHTGVEVAEFLQGEQVLGMGRVAELERGGLVDRHRHRARGRIGAPARMQGDRLGVKRGGPGRLGRRVLVGHGVAPGKGKRRGIGQGISVTASQKRRDPGIDRNDRNYSSVEDEVYSGFRLCRSATAQDNIRIMRHRPSLSTKWNFDFRGGSTQSLRRRG